MADNKIYPQTQIIINSLYSSSQLNKLYDTLKNLNERVTTLSDSDLIQWIVSPRNFCFRQRNIFPQFI